jgi:hypothetical protein
MLSAILGDFSPVEGCTYAFSRAIFSENLATVTLWSAETATRAASIE